MGDAAAVQRMRMQMNLLDLDGHSGLIGGLREQIFANAVHAFPQVVKDHTPFNAAGLFVPASRIFDVVISRPPATTEAPCFQAILTYGPALARKTAVIGSMSDTMVGSLENVLISIGRIIAQTMGTITEELKDVSLETYGAKYDWELISKSKEVSAKKRGK